MTYDREGSGQFTAEKADVTEVFFLEPDDDDPDPPTADDVREKVREILGWTDTDVGSGRITRHLPLAHPLYSNLLAYKVNVRPVPTTFTLTATDETLEVAPPPNFPLWERFEFTVGFETRPFAVLSDDQIQPFTDSYFDDDDTIVNYTYYPEWLRYTDLEILPRENVMKWRQGQFIFQSESGAKPNSVPWTGVGFSPLPDALLRIFWYHVPYRYVKSANSYLERYRYRVNQDDWEDFPAGSLLYKGYTPTRFTPPIADKDESWGPGVYTTEKLCNLVLEFLLTRRAGTDLPTADYNSSWIKAGHNLLPWIKRPGLFFYAAASKKTAPGGEQRPLFLSFPIKKLFQDPDAP